MKSPKPDAIICGMQRCGTSSLYQYLIKHPKISGADVKEVSYFNDFYDKGNEWYQDQFVNVKNFSIEATPNYVINKNVPSRIFDYNPKIKLIFILRNPIDRAWSHYIKSHCGKKSKVHKRPLNFETAFFQEVSKIISKKISLSKPGCFFGKGIYVEFLKNWFKIFPKEQMLILKFEDLVKSPVAIYKKTLKFLDLKFYDIKEYKQYRGSGDDELVKWEIIHSRIDDSFKVMEPTTRKFLLKFYQPFNKELYKLIGRNMRWK